MLIILKRHPLKIMVLFFLSFFTPILTYAIDQKELSDFYNAVIMEKMLLSQRGAIRPQESKGDNLETTELTTLERLYGPLIKQNKFLLNIEGGYYRKYLDGHSGDPNYDKIEYKPTSFYTVKNSLRFTPLNWLEIELGFSNVLPPATTNMLYYTSQGALGAQYKNKVFYIQDYFLNMRTKLEAMEFYLSSLEIRRREKENAFYPTNALYNNTAIIRSHFEDIKAGVRWAPEIWQPSSETNLSKVSRPMLDSKQIAMEAEIGYKRGKMRTNVLQDITPNSTSKTNYITDLSYNFIPQLNFKYGVTERTELDSGIIFTTPLKYKYLQQVFYSNGTTYRLNASYKLNDNFSIPLKLYWRPADSLEIMFASDLKYINQRLDYYQVATDGTVTNHDTKKLIYKNTHPTLKITYLNDLGKQVERDEFSNLTKNLLLQGQSLFEFEFQRDITSLHKNLANGAQNIIDPYSAFIFAPVLVRNTEYSDLFADSTFYRPENIRPQNYYLLQGSCKYGLLDNMNVLARVGYRSESTMHQFVIPEFASTFYDFQPYWFFDLDYDWRIFKNCLFSLKSHFVPKYKTIYKRSDETKNNTIETQYYEIYMDYKVLF